MHILYAGQVTERHMTEEQRAFSRRNFSMGLVGIAGAAGLAGCTSANAAPGIASASCTLPAQTKSFSSAQDWVTAFFEKGAEEVLGYYADDFVWEDIEFMQTITTKEELYKAFLVFNNSGPDSDFGIHKFEVLTYDGGPAGSSKGVLRQGGVPADWKSEGLEADYNRFSNNITRGANLDYDEWGYMQWIWKATHNTPFFGIKEAVGKTTVTRGTTTQMYKNGKIVRCRTHWNFREFAMQLGLIPPPDEAWRNNPGLKS
ncbi:MAG: hypothetical protein WCY11_05005 [Novosphingobium sp.]